MSGEAVYTRSAASGTSSFTLNERVVRLGDVVELDGSVSWAPSLAGRVQPINCYVLKQNPRPILVDTGIALHRSRILRQLDERLPREQRLTTCLTRTELECTGNLGALHAAGRIEEIINAGAIGPFDAYDAAVESSVKITVIPLGSGTSVAIDDPPTIYLIPAFIRMLSTIWIFDTGTRTLFSTDFFGHTSMASRDSTPIIDCLADDETTYESARAHVLAKFWWFPRARTRAMRAWLENIFEEFDVNVIAPTHGCILSGAAVVRRHRDLMLDLLQNVGIDR